MASAQKRFHLGELCVAAVDLALEIHFTGGTLSGTGASNAARNSTMHAFHVLPTFSFIMSNRTAIRSISND